MCLSTREKIQHKYHQIQCTIVLQLSRIKLLSVTVVEFADALQFFWKGKLLELILANNSYQQNAAPLLLPRSIQRNEKDSIGSFRWRRRDVAPVLNWGKSRYVTSVAAISDACDQRFWLFLDFIFELYFGAAWSHLCWAGEPSPLDRRVLRRLHDVQHV